MFRDGKKNRHKKDVNVCRQGLRGRIVSVVGMESREAPSIGEWNLLCVSPD